MGGGGRGGRGGLIRHMYWLRGGGGLYLTSLCSTSPPQGEVGG